MQGWSTRIPKWVRRDLPAKEAAARNRAEETLATITLSRINEESSTCEL